ncbi:unnamed protein product [Protopolystoma xenopodis]|uniref:Uncharacterized protein n=1 Tax=Protopolystoma xenopodis TaxID=117903 RepID=A0A3S5CPT2_9PLAT|nr:unnamed protein product [Protopolystoma xenopodis]
MSISFIMLGLALVCLTAEASRVTVSSHSDLSRYVQDLEPHTPIEEGVQVASAALDGVFLVHWRVVQL